MKKQMDFTSKKALIEVVEMLGKSLDDIVNDITTTWGAKFDESGEPVMVHATKYNRDTHSIEEVFDEDGNPVFEQEYGTIQKPENEYTSFDRAKLSAVETVYNALCKLI